MGNLVKQLAVYLTPGEKLELERFAVLHKKKLSRLCRDIITGWMTKQKVEIGDLDELFRQFDDATKKDNWTIITAEDSKFAEKGESDEKYVLEGDQCKK
jgi:hypothetical protein